MRSRLSPTHSSRRRPAAFPTAAIFRAMVAGLLVLVVAAGPCAPHAAAVGYTVSDLGLAWTRNPVAMNNSGQVVGSWPGASTTAQSWSAFLYDAAGHSQAGTRELGSLVGAPGSPWVPVYLRPRGINDAGQIVGDAELATEWAEGRRWSSFLWRNGSLLDLSTLAGEGPVRADGINDAGQIVGQAGWNQHALLYDAGGVHDLGTLGGASSEAMAINNRGQIAGVSGTSDVQNHLFL
jgi:probable HAF family extracellular repeat protein